MTILFKGCQSFFIITIRKSTRARDIRSLCLCFKSVRRMIRLTSCYAMSSVHWTYRPRPLRSLYTIPSFTLWSSESIHVLMASTTSASNGRFLSPCTVGSDVLPRTRKWPISYQKQENKKTYINLISTRSTPGNVS